MVKIQGGALEDFGMIPTLWALRIKEQGNIWSPVTSICGKSLRSKGSSCGIPAVVRIGYRVFDGWRCQGACNGNSQGRKHWVGRTEQGSRSLTEHNICYLSTYSW